MKDERYNGWTNYETWLVSLWSDNDETSYRRRKRLAQDTWNDAEADSVFTREERATIDLAESLQSETEHTNPMKNNASLWADLMGAALAEVNWYEIAEHLIQEVEKCLPSENEHGNDGNSNRKRITPDCTFGIHPSQEFNRILVPTMTCGRIQFVYNRPAPSLLRKKFA
jgi:hypothetical protein